MSILDPKQPSAGEYPSYYAPYVALAPTSNLIEALEEQGRALSQRWSELPAAACAFAYAEGKWSVAELIEHVVDIERVFSYRAMCFLRGLSDEQPGVDQNIMAANSAANERGLASLGAEFLHQRLSNVELFRHLDESQYDRGGRASGVEFSVRSIPSILYGHAAHHDAVLEERYAGKWA